VAAQSLPNLMRPLEKRTRAEAVTDELGQLSHLTRSQLQARLRDTRKETRLLRETLVSLARTFALAKDMEMAHIALESLIARISPAIRARLRAWAIDTQNQPDVVQDVLVGLLKSWQDTRPTEELWECNFTTPFNTRVRSLIYSALPKSVETESLSTLTSDGAEHEREDWLIDTGSLSMIDQVALRQAMRALHEEHGLWSLVFHAKHVLGRTEEEIAADQGVTSRTVRNRLREAERFLQEHLREEPI
jgi:RNA polymerase sigma factor (sigma-70 family)